jgi:Glycosyl hydrolase family 26
MKPVLRIIIALTAILLGGAIVFGLTYVGKQTQGPIEDVLTVAGDAMRDAEEKIIIEKRTKTRADELPWLKRSTKDLRNPSKILLGAFDENSKTSLRPLMDLEKKLKTTFPLIQLYVAWGSKEEQLFPKIQVESILKSGSVPVITWEPWLTDFDSTLFQNGLRPIETRDKSGLKDIAAGLYDDYLHDWAKAAARIGQPIFLRFGHEMNDPYRYPWGPQNNQAEDFVAAWRHVHAVFQMEKAKNVVWVWSPHPAHGWFKAYYPGDAFVDWVGVGALNYGTVATWSQWWTFDDIFGKYYADLSAFGKPIMISEFGCLAVGGDRKKWYEDALTDLPSRYPQVKGLLFFHFSNDQTTTQQPLDWTIKNDTAIVKVVSAAVRRW